MTTMHPARAYDEVVSFFASGPSRQEIGAFRLSEAALSRLRQLLLKKSVGTLTDDEADELDECVHLDRWLLLIRSRPSNSRRHWVHSEGVGAAQRRLVRDRARRCCEYCGMPDGVPVFPHEPDHIIAIKHGGRTTSDNLAYACFDCNRAKGSDIGSIDLETSAPTPLFSPRAQVWREHFRNNGPVIEARTAVGRATVRLLRMNLPVRVAIRESLMRAGRYEPPAQELSSSDG